MTELEQRIWKLWHAISVTDDEHIVAGIADFAEKEIALAAPAIKAEGRREGLLEATRIVCNGCKQNVPHIRHKGELYHADGYGYCRAVLIHALLSNPAPKEKA